MARTIPLITKAPYVSDLDKDLDDAEKTTWILKPLDGLQHADVMSTGLVNYRLALSFGLVDWQNLKDQNGRAVKFSQDSFKDIPAEYLVDIASEIVDRSELKDEQRKNSS